MKPKLFMTAVQVFNAIEGLSGDAKAVLCEVIMDTPWKGFPDAVKELEAAGLVHVTDGKVKLGRAAR